MEATPQQLRIKYETLMYQARSEQMRWERREEIVAEARQCLLRADYIENQQRQRGDLV